jgi:hypothetical protein
MAENNIRTSGAPKASRDDAGGAVVLPHACLGIVKDNIDPTHSGRIKVYINRGGAVDANDARNWIRVSYLSPWFGVVAPGYDIYGDKSSDRTGDGKYVGNPHSYGFWATAPDVGTTVVCVFINGRSDQGYYIGCVPQPGLTHMVPAVGASAQVVPNSEEAKTYGGADRLPVTEVNYANPAIRNSPAIYNQPKPVHSYQAGILAQQGLIRDNYRGVISSSSQRETPSRVFGISTPGGPIYSGGYDKNTISSVAPSADKSKLQTVGRTGGHSIVLDDGDIKGQDQLMRLRTSAGHMIMMNDSNQSLTLIHSNGRSWVEMNREGAIDVYSTNSVNIRTEGDINLHADRDINMHAKRNINQYAENIQVESEKNTSLRTGQNFSQYTVAKHTVKVDGPMSLESKADASFASKAITYINGRKVHLNTGATGTVPEVVKAQPKQNHVDTTFSQNKGWMNPSPEPLKSIVTRAPTHWPYYAANRGVDVKSGSTQPANAPQPSAGVAAANAGASTMLQNPTNPALVSTAPTVPNPIAPGGPALTPQAAQSMVSQQATAAAAMGAADKVANGIVGTAGSTLSQLASPGQSMKPGSDALVKAIQDRVPNIPGARAATNVLMTGNQGVGSFDNLQKNTSAQVSALAGSFQTSITGLRQSGVLTGTETPTEIAGVVQAGANFGVAAVAGALTKATNVASILGQGTTQLSKVAGLAGAPGAALGSPFRSLGSAVAGGNFSGALSDQVNSGMAGVNNSLAGLASGAGLGDLTKNALGTGAGALAGAATNALGSATALAQGATGALTGITGGALGGITGGLPSLPNLGVQNLISGLKGTAANAFAVTEKGFGELKGGVSNSLGGAAAALRAGNKPLDEQGAANESFELAQNDLAEAQKAYRQDPTAENQAKIKEAEQALAEARKKTLAAAKNLLSGGSPSAQGVAAIAATVESGAATVATTANSGINALPGGVGAYANEISDKSNNIMSSAKSAVSSASAAGAALSGAQNLAGGLLTNAQSIVSNVGSAVAGGIQNAAGALSGALSGAAGGLLGGAKSAATGLFSKMKSGLDSVGNNDNQIKTPILAAGTFSPEGVLKAKVGQLLGDNKIPAPVFSDQPVQVSDKQAEQLQNDRVKAFNALKDVQAKLEKLGVQAKALATEIKTRTAQGQDATQQIAEFKELETQIKQLWVEEDAALKAANAALGG